MISEAGISSAMRRAATTEKTVELKDDGGRGEGRLAMLVRARGKRLITEWYAIWWRDTRRKSVKIGVYPTMGLAEARRVFRDNYARPISQGEDPTGPRTRRTRIGVTVNDLFVAYIDNLRANGKTSANIAERILLGAKDSPKRTGPKVPLKPGASKALGEAKRVCDVTPGDIRDYLSTIHERGSIVMAREARAYLHAAFGYAMKSANSYTSSVGSVDWGLSYNPVTAVPTDQSPEAHRVGERHLTPAELREFWDWLMKPEQDYQSARVLRLMICTGQRVTEILRIDDPAYDRPAKMVDWSKTKNGLPHAAPFPPLALAELDAVVPNTHGMFFPHARRPTEPATPASVQKVVEHYLEDHPKVPRFTPRDIRRTWKTLSGAAGVSKDVRDRLQNHARKDVSSRHYDRYDYLTEKRAGMATWAAYLDRILSGDLDNPVAKLAAAV